MGTLEPGMSMVNGEVVPNGCIPAWILNEEEKNNLFTNRHVPEHRPTTHFMLLEHVSDEVIVGYLGHADSARGKGMSRFHTEIRRKSTAYFENYTKRVPVYITFDKVNVFRLKYILPEPEAALRWYFERVVIPFPTVARQVFMIMPFSDDALDRFYRDNVKQYLHDELQLNVLRADSINDNDVISDTILTMIRSSEFIIADSTACNKNVFYEIGYADAKDKEIILMQNRNEERIFFDKAHRRAIIYDMENPTEFRRQLLATVTRIRSRVAQ